MQEQEVIQQIKEIYKMPKLSQEAELKKITKETDFTLTALREQLKEISRDKKDNDRLQVVCEKEYKAEVKAVLSKNTEEILKLEYDTCNIEVFTAAIDMDMCKIATDAYAKRIIKNNYVITFKDNKRIYIYNKKTGIYEDNGDIIISQWIQKDLKHNAEDRTVKEIQNKIRRLSFMDRKQLKDQSKDYQPVGNGLLNIKTGQIENFTPTLVFFTKIHINYNKDSSCPQFKKFLEVVFEDSPMNIDITQEWMGNLLLNDNRFQRAMMLYGAKGENGKSVLLKVLGNFLGHDNVCSISLQALEKNTFALARLSNKRANIFYDLPKTALSQTSNFKLITSGDPVTAEYKGQDSFEFIPMTKLMFSCNEIPRTPDRTNAFFRRWIVLQFNQTFPEGSEKRIDNLDELLSTKDELEGILLYAYEGLRRLLDNKKFTQNMNSVELREFWLQKSDSVAAFASNKIEKSSSAWTSKRDIYGMYQDYCEDQGYEPLSENIFFKSLYDFMNIEEFRPAIYKDNNQIRVRALRVIEKGKKEINSDYDKIKEKFAENPEKNYKISEFENDYEVKKLAREGYIYEKMEGVYVKI